jgi:SET domain-containing protein
MNHSCQPYSNVAALSPQISDAASFVATRDITIGEELTWTYSNDVNLLESHYGFKCSCPNCAPHPQ